MATSDAQGRRDLWPAALGCLVKPYGPGELTLAVAACEALLRGGKVGFTPHSLELFDGES